MPMTSRTPPSRRISGPRTWSAHYQDVWLERTHNRDLPAWLRVAFLAYGSHRANGHAPFEQGDVGLVLGSVDRVTGEIRPADKANVQRAIRNAVKAGWLAEGSSARCLVVPGHAVEGGLGGAPDEPCGRHSRKGQPASLRAVS